MHRAKVIGKPSFQALDYKVCKPPIRNFEVKEKPSMQTGTNPRNGRALSLGLFALELVAWQFGNTCSAHLPTNK